MIEAIKDFAKEIDQYLARNGVSQDGTWLLARTDYSGPIADGSHSLVELAKLLDELQAQDFDPGVQTSFMIVRAYLRDAGKLIRESGGPGILLEMHKKLISLVSLLDSYRGPGSGGAKRDFSFVIDPALRGIVERDYAELTDRQFPAGAWKSTVVMAGSILEAILVDQLEQKASDAILAAKRLESKRSNDIAKWPLDLLLKVAADNTISLLRSSDEQSAHAVLRAHRNFIHAARERSAEHACSRSEAMMAVGLLDRICDHLTP